MSACHTPQRLKAFTLYAHPEIRTEGDELIATLQSGREPIARRLAACWNACEGIETSMLEREPYLSTAAYAKRKAVEEQSTDMLAALIVAREFISTDRNSLSDNSTYPDGRMDPDDAAAVADYDAALVQIDAAIKQATEATPS